MLARFDTPDSRCPVTAPTGNYTAIGVKRNSLDRSRVSREQRDLFVGRSIIQPNTNRAGYSKPRTVRGISNPIRPALTQAQLSPFRQTPSRILLSNAVD